MAIFITILILIMKIRLAISITHGGTKFKKNQYGSDACHIDLREQNT
jgi:hypothetical protein